MKLVKAGKAPARTCPPECPAVRMRLPVQPPARKGLPQALRAPGACPRPVKDKPLDMRELLMLAIATSIDALAVGVSFAFLEVDIAPAVSLIGCTTFAISLAGVAIGNFFGSRWEKPATIAGGLVLVAIGARILLEGLGVLG